MKRVWLVLLPTVAALAGVEMAACSMSGDDLGIHAAGGDGATSHGGAGGSGASGGGDAGVDADFGGGAAPVGPLDYAELCGGGCVPAAGDDTPCGGGGSGGGTAEDTCILAYDTISESVTGQCAPSGAGVEGTPCLSTAQCGSGLACGDGACRRYCCGELEACPGDTYCIPRPVDPEDLPLGVATVPLIPLCMPIEPCELLSPSSCPTGESCTIVRAGGTTSCVVPGEGTAGHACPCAADHYCAAALDTCFQLCRTTNSADCPVGHSCQGGNAPFPEGFGICVPQ